MDEYIKSFQRIDDLGRRAGALEPDDLIRAHTAQHICVLVSGTLEKACSSLLSSHVSGRSAPSVARFATQGLGRLQNMGPPKIEQLLQSFDPTWKDEVDSFWAGRIRDAIASVVNNRNQIAHGQQVNVSLAQALQWAKDVKAFCDKLREIALR